MRTPLFVVAATPKTIKVAFLSIALFFTCCAAIAQHRTQLWGASDRGGPLNEGYVFKYDVAANTLSKEAWFNKANYTKTYYGGIFKSDNNYLYSVKSQNDSTDKATIVRVNRKTNKLETLYTFDPEVYDQISATFTEYKGKYYGLIWGGWESKYTSASGILFVYDPVANTVTNKFYFNQGQYKGWITWGQLFEYNNKLYGAAAYGVAVDTLKAGSLKEGPHTLKYVYTSPGGCKDSMSVSFYIANCPDGTNPVTSAAFTPYPNPSSGTVRLQNNEQLLTTVKVFNGQGFNVYTKTSSDAIIVLDLSAVQTGIYYISVTNSKGTASGKVEIVK